MCVKAALYERFIGREVLCIGGEVVRPWLRFRGDECEEEEERCRKVAYSYGAHHEGEI